jgi:prepilin-type N-terminal cleavage/methylation domain-containing protein
MWSGETAGGRISAGFTLIEMMLAVAVLALILVMLAGSFHAVATSKVEAENNIALDSAARVIVAEMAHEIRGAVQTSGILSRVLLVGEAHGRGTQALDSITFSTLNPGHRRSVEDFGTEDTVTYTVVPNPNHSGWFMLMRNQSSSLLDIGTDNHSKQSVLLADNLLLLRIRYFDGSSWTENWNSQTLPPGRQLPNEVAVELTVAGRSGLPFSVATTVTVPMAYLQW